MSDETIAELARMLAEERRARKLAEAAVMVLPTEQPIGDGVAAGHYKSLAEQRGDELETAQAQIVELRPKLTEAGIAVRWQKDRAENAQAELDRMQRTRSQVLVGRAGDASRLEQELRVLRDELAAEKASAASLTVDLARVTDELAKARSECHAALGRVAVVEDDLAAHKHDAAEVARLRALLREVIKAWKSTPPEWTTLSVYADELIARAARAARGES